MLVLASFVLVALSSHKLFVFWPEVETIKPRCDRISNYLRTLKATESPKPLMVLVNACRKINRGTRDNILRNATISGEKGSKYH